jgi:hypothetical protein
MERGDFINSLGMPPCGIPYLSIFFNPLWIFNLQTNAGLRANRRNRMRDIIIRIRLIEIVGN